MQSWWNLLVISRLNKGPWIFLQCNTSGLLISCKLLKWFNPGKDFTTSYNTTRCNTMQWNAMQLYQVQYNAMQCNATLPGAMQCNAMQCNAMQCNAMQLYQVQCQQAQHCQWVLCCCCRCLSSYWRSPKTVGLTSLKTYDFDQRQEMVISPCPPIFWRGCDGCNRSWEFESLFR